MCKVYNRFKKTSKSRYDKLPINLVELIPWTDVYADDKGPYTVKRKKFDAKCTPI